QPVGGLVRGATYQVQVVDPTTLRFFDPVTGDMAVLTSPGSGSHAFSAEVDVRLIDPVTAVDPTTNTITFSDPHGLATGPPVVYRTDPSATTVRPLGTVTVTRDLGVADADVLRIGGAYAGLLAAGSSA